MYEIFLPLPTKKLSTNYRGSTQSKSHRREVRTYRSVCAFHLLQAKAPTLNSLQLQKRVVFDLEFFYGPSGDKYDRYYRARDESNALGSTKGLQDALADAGVIKCDTKKYLKIGYVTLHTTKKEHGGRCGVLLRLRYEDEPVEPT